MKKRNLQRIFAAFMATAMALSAAGCSKDEGQKDEPQKDEPKKEETKKDETKKDETVEPVATDAPVDDGLIRDANGNVVDLGGIEVIIRDWWSGDPTEPTNEYEEALQEYRDYIQETYNFKIKSQAISDWGSAPTDFVDYATTGGDEYYLFVLRDDPAVTSAMSSGLMYDLATLDCLDFSQEKFQQNKLHEMYAKGNSIYCMYAGLSEPRTGVYFNKAVLIDAGVDPETIYDMQANGTWTWDAFDEIMGKCQRDKDNDGANDVFGLTINESVMTMAAVYSNNGSLVGKDAAGMYTYNLEAPQTLEALEWCVKMYSKYDNHDPEGANWDYYKEEFLSGKVAFMVDDAYCGYANGWLVDADFEIGFVMFPKGPQGGYVNCWSNNPHCIPSCYDADKAWKIAFAWNLYTEPTPGYEDHMDLSNYMNGIFDDRAVNETCIAMMQGEHGMVAYHGLIPNMDIGSQLTWSVSWNTASITELVEGIRETWKAYIDEANK